MTKKDDNGVIFLAPEAEPPAKPVRAGYTRWNAVADQLGAHPNVWAIVLETKEGEPGYSSFHGKKIALTRGRDNIDAEVRTENGVRRLYARFVTA